MMYLWQQKMSGELIAENWYVDCGEYILRYQYSYLNRGGEWLELMSREKFIESIEQYRPKKKKAANMQLDDLTGLIKMIFIKDF